MRADNMKDTKMTKKLIRLSTPLTVEWYGGCPHCGGSDGYLNIRNSHWGCCKEHRVKWLMGEDLFSAWQDEDASIWLENSIYLSDFDQAEPLRDPTSDVAGSRRNIAFSLHNWRAWILASAGADIDPEDRREDTVIAFSDGQLMALLGDLMAAEEAIEHLIGPPENVIWGTATPLDISEQRTAESKPAAAGQPDTPSTDEYFGGCPTCGKSDGYSNVGRNHWGSCDAHKVKWSIGSNLFSSWHDEDETVWQKNAERLSTYREVKPIYGHDDAPERSPVTNINDRTVWGEEIVIPL